MSGEVSPATTTPIHAADLTNVALRDTIRSVVMSDEPGFTAVAVDPDNRDKFMRAAEAVLVLCPQSVVLHLTN